MTRRHHRWFQVCCYGCLVGLAFSGGTHLPTMPGWRQGLIVGWCLVAGFGSWWVIERTRP